MKNSGNEITLMTSGGVGYVLFVNSGAAKKWPVGVETEVFTYLAVRENAMDLFGFQNEGERALFLKFLNVSGIGPKTAMHLLSLGTVDEIASAVSRGDVDYLTKVSGIGRKTAERIVVELKEKMAAGALAEETSEGGLLGDVVDGLIALGYSTQEAREAVKKLDANGKTSEQLLKEALQRIK